MRVCLGTVVLLFIGLGCGGSSDSLCDRACTAWNSCTQVAGNTVNYPYDTCFAECKEEGDWDAFYVSCVEDQTTCPAIGNECG